MIAKNYLSKRVYSGVKIVPKDEAKFNHPFIVDCVYKALQNIDINRANRFWKKYINGISI